MSPPTQPITAPRAGQTLTFVTERPDLLVMEAQLQPGARVPAHVHPVQEERFVVLEGEPLFVVAGKRVRSAPGSPLTLAPGTPHRFHNDTADRVRLRAELRPALSTRAFFEELFALDRAGKTNRFGVPGPLAVRALARRHGDAFPWLALAPLALQRPLLEGRR